MIARLTLTVRSPFLIGGEQELASGLDAVLLRNASGKAIIPGTTMKGMLRDALQSLLEMGHPLITEKRVEGWFGQPSSYGNEPVPGTLSIGDLVAQTEEKKSGAHYSRVAIDEATGSALAGALQFIELPWPVGADVDFSGEIQSASGTFDQETIGLLTLALNAIPALGSMRGIGFGRISKRALVLETEPTAVSVAEAFDHDHDLLLIVRFMGAFVVASDRPDQNSFVGADLVPGGALKGAIAEAVHSNPDVSALLSAVTIYHGFPVPASQIPNAQDYAPQPIARSIALVLGAELCQPALIDLIEHVDAPLLDCGPGHDFLPLCLATDWKPADFEAVEKALSELNRFEKSLSARPQRERRTRAAIDRNTGTALDRQLFSHDAVSPTAKDGSDLVWAFRIAGTEGQLRELNERTAGLRLSLGKLDTAAIIIETRSIPKRQAGTIDDKIVITLVTPAVLNSFAQLEEAGGSIAGAYAAYFSGLHPSVRLERFFATQKLITGYQAKRFRSNPDRFEPWVRTEAGSIFVLSFHPKGNDAVSAKDLVADWIRHGLPAAGSAAPDAWKYHPYPRENGYGQIIVGAMSLPPLPAGFAVVEGGAA